MTQNQKANLSNNIIKWVPATVTPIGVIMVVWMVASFKAKYEENIESIMFDNPQQKVSVLNHVKSAPNEVDNYVAYRRLDSLTKSYKRDRDLELKKQDRRDSLILRNATTIYQMKQSQEKQARATDKILQTLENQTQ